MALDRRTGTPLLDASDPSPFTIVNPCGRSPFLFTGDHAGRAVPSVLATLGLDQNKLSRHIAWDIGVGALGELLADALDATFIRQNYSRLVVDCNRPPTAVDAIATISDGTPIPGNARLSEHEKSIRFAAVHEPYQRAIGEELERRRLESRVSVIISIHSFTPALRVGGADRPWHIGVLHHLGDVTLAHRLLDALGKQGGLRVGDNEPYRMTGGCTIPRHAYPTRIPYALLEVRQDLLSTATGLDEWAQRLADALRKTMVETTRP